MKPKYFAALFLLVLGMSVLRIAWTARANTPSGDQIQHGQYLVERVAMCADCHTPKTDSGDYDRSMWLQGDVVEFKPVRPTPFAVVAPGIAGLPGYTNDDLAIKFFETGTNAFGKRAMPPMPQFRFNHEDAMAVVVYLRSLKK